MIYFVIGAPREGKTFFATYKALKEMRKRKPRKVFSNYPIIYEEPYNALEKIANIFRKLLKKPPLPKKLYSSYIWKPEYIYENIQNSMILIDEAYRDYSSRNFKNFKLDEHTFFATNGHNNLDIYLLAQGVNRIDVIIREMVNKFYFIKKNKWPLTDKPMWFTIEGFLSEDDFIMRKNDSNVHSREHLRLRGDVAKAYNTHYFRNPNPEPVLQTWKQSLDEKDKKEIKELPLQIL